MVSVLVLPLFVPYAIDSLLPLIDEQNQTIHDKVVGSVILRA